MRCLILIEICMWNFMDWKSSIQYILYISSNFFCDCKEVKEFLVVVI